MPKITENPEVQSHDFVRSIIFLFLLFSASIVLFLYCPTSLLSRPTIVLSHTIGSTGLLTLLSYPLLSQLLLFYLSIILAYYTALNRHSIHSSTFLVYDSLSRVSCLSWQSTHSLGSFLLSALEMSIPVAETKPYPFP